MQNSSLPSVDSTGSGQDAAATNSGEILELARTLITTRHHISPRRLTDPGPDDHQLNALFTLAAAAPDHGRITPWRFIIVPAATRPLLAEVFAQALLDRDPAATADQLGAAREKAYRAPMLMIAVARLGPAEPNTPTLERMISMGAAIQNLLLGAHAMGFGSGLTSGQAMTSSHLRTLLELEEGEMPVCCVNIGTIARHKLGPSERPSPEEFTAVL